MRLKRITTAVISGLIALCASAQGVISVDSKASVLPDGNVELLLTVNLEPGWYMYSTVPVSGGPMATSFTADGSSAFTLSGGLQDVEEAHVKLDEGFGIDVKYFEGTAQFRQVIVPASQEPFTVTGYLEFQTCNGAECTLNESEVSVKVDPSAAPGNTSAAPAAVTADDSSASGTSSGQGFWSFLLIAFLAGLAGVITPCVFPMIPMTVGFLIGGGSTRRAGVLKGVIFGLSIMVIYTLLGLVVALFQSTAATDAIGTHWIPNLIFALLFLVFAVSFLGAFEITLPSGLANKADREADKGGYVAAFFVALAMVIVSFSCTGPFVGSILAAAVLDGVALRPIVGMAVFGLGFSLPFVVLSFFPGVMKKLPKSGGWLNMVKVVFAYIMLAFAMKFLYNIDAYFGWGIITRLGFIASWVVLALLLGLYFLGVFRTSHDSPTDGIGWGRHIAAIVCITFAFYLIPGLFGAPLQSISGLIPPMDGSTLTLSQGGSQASSGDNAAAATGYSTLEYHTDLDKALAESKATGKPVFVVFKSHTCSVCKQMEATVLSSAAVMDRLSGDFVIAHLYVDDKTEDAEFRTLGRRYRDLEMRQFASASQPLYAVVDAEGNTLSGPIGSCSEEEFLNFLNF
ncbi:MAG TPA: thioredoxin family protein [Candidatus Coprenecus merdipullorum]|nr:thioredoxin family protein [Candidatus Coprenecus merdipullorum]